MGVVLEARVKPVLVQRLTRLTPHSNAMRGWTRLPPVFKTPLKQGIYTVDFMAIFGKFIDFGLFAI